jgi:hypothetical protein
MARVKFTEAEMGCLRKSGYVLDVSPSTVHFSAEFKKEFWDAMITGKKPRDIITELGIDPDILGETRIAGIKTIIRKEAESGKGFRDLETYKSGINGFMTAEAKIKALEQKLAYKEQEIEFIKKIASLSREGAES